MRRTRLEENILFLAEDDACLGVMAKAMAKPMDREEIDQRLAALFLDPWRHTA